MFRLICVLIGYALGHFQTAYILGRIKGIDIREHGSKSAGMTNINRVMGKKYAIPVLIMDIAKSIGAFVLCAYIFGGTSGFSFIDFTDRATLWAVIENPWLPGLYGSLGAILGHMFPTYMRFKGGKSVACGIGLVIILSFNMSLVILSIALVIILAFKYISLASIISLVLMPVWLAVFDFPMEVIGVGYFLTMLMIFKHKDNLKRLLNGNENKIGRK